MYWQDESDIWEGDEDGHRVRWVGRVTLQDGRIFIDAEARADLLQRKLDIAMSLLIEVPEDAYWSTPCEWQSGHVNRMDSEQWLSLRNKLRAEIESMK